MLGQTPVESTQNADCIMPCKVIIADTVRLKSLKYVLNGEEQLIGQMAR